MGVWTPWRKDQHLNYPPSRVLFPTMVTDRQPSGLPTEPRPMPGFSHQDELDPVEALPRQRRPGWQYARKHDYNQQHNRTYDDGVAHPRHTTRTSERTDLHVRGRTQASMSTNKRRRSCVQRRVGRIRARSGGTVCGSSIRPWRRHAVLESGRASDLHSNASNRQHAVRDE